MKKLISITLSATILFVSMPPDTLALRPAAYRASSAGSKQSTDILIQAAKGKQAENHYAIESNIARGFTTLDHNSGGEIGMEIQRRIDVQRNRPVKILLIGPGRGFEAFEMMHAYNENIEVTTVSKEDLLYVDPEDLVIRFGLEGERITRKYAGGLIEKLNARHIISDIDEGINLETGLFDLVIFGTAVTGYVKNKYWALKEGLRLAAIGGTLFIRIYNSNVETGHRDIALQDYLARQKNPHIKECNLTLKIIKLPGLNLPDLMLARSSRLSRLSKGASAWRTDYRIFHVPQILKNSDTVSLSAGTMLQITSQLARTEEPVSSAA
jgi:hypothetical protein